MYRIQTFNQIAERGLAELPEQGFVAGPDVAEPHAILLRSHRLGTADIGPQVSAVARAGAGVNNVPVQACTERGIVVFNTPGANANSVKELVLAALLLASRDVLGGFGYVRSLADVRDGDALHRRVEAEKRRYRGREIAGRTLGIVGLGAVGSRVARAALHLGMEVLGYDPALSVEAAWRLPSDVRRMSSLATLLTRAEYITLHVPSVPQTRHLIDAAALAEFRSGAVLLNFAREEIVDAAAVREALTGGRLRAYFTDFPSTALAGLDSVHATPHLGASTAEAEENCAIMAVSQLRDFLRHGNVSNAVNFPSVAIDAPPGCRIAVANRNVAGLLGHLLSVFADARINVVDMINRSRDTVAYNLIDIAEPAGGDVIRRIEAIGAVLRVRVLESAA